MKFQKGKTTFNTGVVGWGAAAGLLLTSWGWLGHPASVLAAPSPNPKNEISASSFASSPGESSLNSSAVRAPTEPPPFDPNTPPAIDPKDVKLSVLPPEPASNPTSEPATNPRSDSTSNPASNPSFNATSEGTSEGTSARSSDQVNPAEQVAPPQATRAHTLAPAGGDPARPPSPDAGRMTPESAPAAELGPASAPAPASSPPAPPSPEPPPATSGIIPPAPRAIIPQTPGAAAEDTLPLEPVEQLR